MKKLFVLAAVALVATSAHAGEMKWSGAADWRYDQTKYDDQIGTTSSTSATQNSQQTVKQHEIKASLGVNGGWENVEYGIGLRTQTATNNAYVNMSSTDLAVGIDQAFVKYSHDFSVLDLAATLGRQKNVFAYEGSSQLLFSNDDRFNGLGWNFKLGSFGLNAAQYVLGSDGTGTNSKVTTTNSVAANLSMLYGFQPYMNWRFTDEIDAFLGIGYYSWNNLSNATGNTGNGGFDDTTYNSNATAASTLAIGSLHQWQFTTNVNLPYSLAFGGEYITNKAGNYVKSGVQGAKVGDNSAWTAGLSYGKVKKAHDWSLSYYYASKGIDSVLSSYSNVLFPADNKGHIIEAKYNLADNFHIGAEFLMLKAKSNMNGAGTLYTASGTSNSQQEKSSYWEVNAGVAF